MSVQTYKITRKGAQHVRFEWPNGEPVKGRRFTMNSANQFVPLVNKDKGGEPVRVVYGFKRPDAPYIRDEIRLTAAGAQALKHMGLVPIVGTASESEPGKRRGRPPKVNGDQATDTAPADQGAGDAAGASDAS